MRDTLAEFNGSDPGDEAQGERYQQQHAGGGQAGFGDPAQGENEPKYGEQPVKQGHGSVGVPGNDERRASNTAANTLVHTRCITTSVAPGGGDGTSSSERCAT